MGDSVSGVGVLDKAASVLGTLEAGPLALADLAERAGLPRATTHRLAAALECHGLVSRDDRGRFVLGARLVDLGRAAEGGRRLADSALPALRTLRDRTGESTQLFVVEGDRRVCVVATESPHSLRTIVAAGAALPMDRGSAAKVLAGDASALRRGWDAERGGAGAGGGVGQRAGRRRRPRRRRGVGVRSHRTDEPPARPALRGGGGGSGANGGTGAGLDRPLG